ncbi:MAG TPA: sulfotransferase domain-containing protein [Balneolales bacterium]|nr:sulfotransferase domain-containing protein [Balneolales bacterium]
MDYFLVTGMSRSGTTLLIKMLDSHHDICALSQPLPLVYRNLKKVFYKKINYPETYYVLNNLFNEKRYSSDDLMSFLNNYEISSESISKILDEMEGWSGQWTEVRDRKALLRSFNSLSLSELYRLFLKSHSSPYGYKVCGSKEVLVEEFAPYYVSKGIKILFIVRDPRDVITSLNIGKGPEYAGDHRPTLFHLRNWRKSIAIANSIEDRNKVLTIRYEDLIDQRYDYLSRITNFLNVEPFRKGHFNKGIKTSNGKLWKGNSSTATFNNINAGNKQKFKDYLTDEAIKYIEYMCLPEMLLYGYSPLFRDDLKVYGPSRFQEPFDIRTTDINRSLSTDRQELYREERRKAMLTEKAPSMEEVERFFVSNENYRTLKQVII